MSRQRELFEEINDLSYRVRSLSGIVQNGGAPVTDDELNEWRDIVSSCIGDLMHLKDEVTRFIDNDIQ